MGKWKFYLLLPMLAVLAFGSVSFAQEFDKDAFKAELRAELKAELKKELLSELKEEMKAEILSETKAEVQEATLGLRDVLRTDFADEIRAEIMQEDISGAVEEALAGSAIMGGLFNGVTIGGFIDTNFMYNLRLHGEGTAENATSNLNFIGENEDNTFVLENFAMFMDKETTDDDPIGWQMHTYWGEKAKRITFLGIDSDVDQNDRFTIATANISWNAPVLGKHVNITMGKMYTWIGYELVENIGNPNYTHSQTYNNAIPFTHMGVSFDVSEFLPSDKLGLTLYYVNGWDSFIDNNESKSFGAYLTYQPNDDFFISLAGIIGNEGWSKHSGETIVAEADASFTSTNNNGNTMMYNVVATYSLPQVDKLSLGLDWNHGYVENFVPHDGGGAGVGSVAGDGIVDNTSGAHWWAVVGYAMYDYTDNQMGAFRYEYYDDQDAAKAFGYSLWTVTYTHNITVAENLMIRPEIRYNKYNTPTADDPIASDQGNDSHDNETIIGVGAEYIF